jgi:predicted Zn-ribbon and HTH transcriptional regulator
MRPRDVIELAGLARALELGGIYNGAKLVRAVLERELLRLADGRRPAAGEPAARALEDLAVRVDGDGEPDLARALRAASEASRRDTTLLLADAPRVFTCRTCGHLAMVEAPERCPRCEAPGVVFREHLAVWYLEPIPALEVLAELAAGPDRVDAIVASRDDDTLARRPRDMEWSARDTLEHFVTAEELLTLRVPRMLGEDNPLLVAAAAWAATGDDTTTQTTRRASELAARFRTLREETVVTLRELSDSQWERSGRHPEWGTVTVRSQAAYFARHQASHMAQLAAAAKGRVPGETR